MLLTYEINGRGMILFKVYMTQKFFSPKLLASIVITCNRALFFFWQRRREKGEGKKIMPDTFIEGDSNHPLI